MASTVPVGSLLRVIHPGEDRPTFIVVVGFDEEEQIPRYIFPTLDLFPPEMICWSDDPIIKRVA